HFRRHRQTNSFAPSEESRSQPGVIPNTLRLTKNRFSSFAKRLLIVATRSAIAGELPSLVKEGWLRPSTKCREASIAGAAGVVCGMSRSFLIDARVAHRIHKVASRR